jgi:DNA helicase II / ATP-dependent DNA helicase PcrA
VVVIEPDDEQLAILASTARFNAIDGNAGAAKTTTLTLKVLDALRHGMAPQDILVLTYSPAAVLAFQQRLRWIGVEREIVLRLNISTFDALCHERLQMLQGDCEYLKVPTRQVYETVQRAIQQARIRAERHNLGSAFIIPGEGTLLIPVLLHAFRRLKGTLAVEAQGNEFVLTEASALEAGLDFTETAVLQSYEALRYGLSDEPRSFRDSLAPLFRLPDDPFYDMACALTADDPVFDHVSHPLRLGTRLILVDEGHDLNRAMFTVLQHLVEVNPVEQVFVVGDRDQVVHSDGGADAGFMNSDFEAGIGKLQPLPLTTCRRFSERLSGPLGVHASKEYAVATERNTEITVLRARTTSATATLIDGVFNHGGQLDNGRPSSLAVLLRHPGASVELESALEKRGFHVETHGFEPFLKRPEVQFLRTLVAWVTQSVDTLAQSNLLAIQDAFAEFTGCRGHETTKDVRHKNLPAFKDYFLGDPGEFVRGIRHEGPMLSFVDDEARAALHRFIVMFAAGIEPNDLHLRLQEVGFAHLFKHAFVYDEQVEEAMAAMTSFARTALGFETFAGWLKGMAQREWAAKSERRGHQRVIRLYAIPAAKGLEFDDVVMPDVDAAHFDGSAQEERNLFYVGASRARLRLTMTFRDRPSSFLHAFGRESDWDEVVGSGENSG